MLGIRKRYIIGGAVAILLFLVLFFLSTIVKNWLVNHSEKLIGRKVEIGELHFNYAKIAVQAKDVVIYEKDPRTPFFSFHEFYLNFDPWALLGNEYSVSEIRLDQAKLAVIQKGEHFNFDDLLESKDSIKTQAPEPAGPKKELKFKVQNIQLINGFLSYHDELKNSQMEMKDLNLALPLIAWNNNKSDMDANFSFGEKGKVAVNASVDNQNKKYLIEVKTKDVDLKPFTSYLTDYMDVSRMNGLLSSQLKINGDLNEIINITVTGKGAVSDFAMFDGRSKEIISAPLVTATISNVDLKKFHFGFSGIEITQPHLTAVRDKNAINVMLFFAPYFRNDSIATALIAAGKAKAEAPVTYQIDTLHIKNGWVSFTDRTLNRPFAYDLKQLDFSMTGFSESADQIALSFSSKLNKQGEVSGKATFSMVNLMNLTMDMAVKKLDLLSFSPYSEYYVASPIKQGWGNYGFTLKMSPTYLKNDNAIRIEELEFGKRTKDKTAMKVPVRLALYIMKDANDVIAFDLPVEGNPAEPHFRLGKIIWKTLANLMVKTALSPFKALAGLVGANPESIEKLPYAFAQDSLDAKQRGVLLDLVKILKKKPDLGLVMTQFADEQKEKEQIGILLARKNYWLSKGVTIPDSLKVRVARLSNDDPNFRTYLKTSIPDLETLGFEKACGRLAGSAAIDARFNSLLQERNQLIRFFLVDKQGLDAASVVIATTDLRNIPEELRKPQFKIEVSLK